MSHDREAAFSIFFWLCLGAVGFLVGGVVAEAFGRPGRTEFWIGGLVGLAVVWGVPLCLKAGCDFN